MAMHVHEHVIHLTGACPVEDAETLFGLLRGGSVRGVDVSQAGHLHAAVLQVLLACRPPVAGPPADPFIATWLWPLLNDPEVRGLDPTGASGVWGGAPT
jgi:hypothetical protein